MRAPDAHDVLIGHGRRLHVRRWRGTGRPLVLLHGLLDDSEGWAQLAADTHRPCLAIDLPGFGGSDLPREPRISAYADDVAAGLRRLDIRDCTLVGHSLGGAVATAVAERSPAVASLTLLAPAGYGRIRLAEAMSLPGVVDVAELALPVALLNPLVCVAAYSTFVAHRKLPSPDLLQRGCAAARSTRRPACAPRPRRSPTPAATETASRAAQVEFDGPVAALWGEHDALVPRAHIDALAMRCPRPTSRSGTAWATTPSASGRPSSPASSRCAPPAPVAPRAAQAGGPSPRCVARTLRAMRLATFLPPGATGPASPARCAATRSSRSTTARPCSTGSRAATARRPTATRAPLADVTLLAPVPRPRAIFGIGLNYADARRRDRARAARARRSSS